MTSYLELFVAILLLSLGLTGVVRWVSKRVGFVSYPDGHRWNKRVVALGGGVAIFLAISAGFLWKGNSLVLSIYPAFLLMFLLGFYDDVWGASPSAKLIVQFLCAAFVVSKGYVAPFPWAIPGIALTVIWIVGMTNSLNLIDNMDGLASGCTAVAALGMAYVIYSGDVSFPGEVVVLVCVAGAAFGFLFHNFNPARIFMGDAGSLPLGFLLAVFSTRMRLVRPEIPLLFSAVLILLLLVVPLLDTFLVIVSRRSAKRSITIGGRDHTSHRLVALGLSERKAVLILCFLGAVGAISAALALKSSLPGVLTIFSAVVVISVLFAIFLLEIAVYPAVEGESTTKAREPFPIHIQFLIEIALDACVVSACWLTAHLIRFHDTGLLYYKESTIIPYLPLVIGAKLVAVFVLRLYRGIWHSISSRDIYQIFKAAVLGSVFLAFGLLISTRFKDVSRMVLVMDGLLCFLALVGTRTGVISFRRWIHKIAAKPMNVVFYGDGVFLPLVEEALKSNKEIQFKGIIQSPEELEPLVKAHALDLVLTTKDAEHQISAKAKQLGLLIRRLQMQLT